MSVELSRKQCTCSDRSCPFHPTNHDKGCTLCIQKNLQEKEIPSCFFDQIDKEYQNIEGNGFKQEDFAKLVCKVRNLI